MIKIPTVFVLGAGASMAYGFPSGRTLKALIWKMLETIDYKYLIRRAMGNPEQNAFDITITNFRSELGLSSDETIDYFLEHVTEEKYRIIGRLAIAFILLQREQKESLYDDWMNYFALEKEEKQQDFLINKKIRPNDGHWYQYLFNQMCEDCKTIETFHENKLEIITFNYERSLEYYFLHSLASKYKVSISNSAKELKNIKIIHVYGQLGSLPELWDNTIKIKPVIYGDNPMKNDEAVSILKDAAYGIQLIWDGTEENPNIKLAQNIITPDKRIVFLGFGYDPINIERIIHPTYFNRRAEQFKVWGTNYGVSKQRIESLKRRYSSALGGGHGSAYFNENSETYFPKNSKIYDLLRFHITL